ncbi:arginase family protein [Labrys wisconsinensis]|uniref:Arginase n=1 Tax=Labrys wisconsinensis TaxID=425677 RepID=A0ABU0IZF3_9HYPH|nr:arginase family protein [Labrys wisconsinensis]MDQ0467389.1 arginase [Labrys wisconsinensis]
MKVALIVVPYDSGRFMARWGLGPIAIRRAGLAEALTAAGHNVTEATVLLGDPDPREVTTGFAVAAEIARLCQAALAGGRFPLVIAGNCLSAVGVCAGIGADAAVWFDAHGDLNTPETSGSGLLDGMALATVLGACWPKLAGAVPGFAPIHAGRVVLAGARDLDPPEAALIAARGIAHVPAGEAATAARAATQGAARAYVHLDLDVLDPAMLSVNRYAVPGGASLEALGAAVHDVAHAAPVTGAAITAYDPAVDPDGRTATAAVSLATALVAAVADRWTWDAVSAAVKL